MSFEGVKNKYPDSSKKRENLHLDLLRDLKRNTQKKRPLRNEEQRIFRT